MPVFTSLGLALGATSATALSVGLGATALAGGIGYGAYSLGKSSGAASAPARTVIDVPDTRIDTEDTGEITVEEAQTAAKKRLYRSGILFTSPTGLEEAGRTSSAKLR